jgi:hypothetical protein
VNCGGRIRPDFPDVQVAIYIAVRMCREKQELSDKKGQFPFSIFEGLLENFPYVAM